MTGPLTFVNDQHPSLPPPVLRREIHFPQKYGPILLPEPNAGIRVDRGPLDIDRCDACTGGDKHILRSVLAKDTDDLPQADRLARACGASSGASGKTPNKMRRTRRAREEHVVPLLHEVDDVLLFV